MSSHLRLSAPSTDYHWVSVGFAFNNGIKYDFYQSESLKLMRTQFCFIFVDYLYLDMYLEIIAIHVNTRNL